MADITGIKAIIHTEKSLGLQEDGVVVVKTNKRMTKNALKEVFKKYWEIVPLRVNSLNQRGKIKRFRGKIGKQVDFKKFYVKLPEGAQIQSLAV